MSVLSSFFADFEAWVDHLFGFTAHAPKMAPPTNPAPADAYPGVLQGLGALNNLPATGLVGNDVQIAKNPEPTRTIKEPPSRSDGYNWRAATEGNTPGIVPPRFGVNPGEADLSIWAQRQVALGGASEVVANTVSQNPVSLGRASAQEQLAGDMPLIAAIKDRLAATPEIFYAGNVDAVELSLLDSAPDIVLAPGKKAQMTPPIILKRQKLSEEF